MENDLSLKDENLKLSKDGNSGPENQEKVAPPAESLQPVESDLGTAYQSDDQETAYQVDDQETAYQAKQTAPTHAVEEEFTPVNEDQATLTHAAEDKITPVDEDRDAKHFVLVGQPQEQAETKHFVLVGEPEDQAEMINQADQSVAEKGANQAELVTDNQLISEKHNSSTGYESPQH